MNPKPATLSTFAAATSWRQQRRGKFWDYGGILGSAIGFRVGGGGGIWTSWYDYGETNYGHIRDVLGLYPIL